MPCLLVQFAMMQGRRSALSYRRADWSFTSARHALVPFSEASLSSLGAMPAGTEALCDKWK